MIKQYFADGLLSIAIILSLLRTDLNHYFGSSLNNYPEIQDIILGNTVAYSPTTFHNLINSIDGYQIHPKSITNEYLSSEVFGELRSLSRFRRFYGLNTGISAFLVNPTNPVAHHASDAETHTQTNPSHSSASLTDTSLPVPTQSSSAESEDVNNNLGLGTSSNSAQEAVVNTPDDQDKNDTDGAFALPATFVLSDPFSDSTLTAADLTTEDLDLIEVLWRQDIDLGIGKEVFDLNLRRELERERELELLKQREKQKELELLQFKLEEERRRQAQQWLAQNFVRDGETGEWIPVNSSVPLTQQNLAVDTTPDQSQEDFSLEEAFKILDGTIPLPSDTLADLENYISNGTVTNIGCSYMHMENISVAQTNIDNLIESADQFNGNSTNQPAAGVQLQQQASLEQSWQDLVSVLQLSAPTNGTVTEPMDVESNPSILQSEEASTLFQETAVLLQNATMPQPMGNNSNAIPSSCSFTNTSYLPPADNYNATAPHTVINNNSTVSCPWNATDMLFSDMTDAMNQSDPLDEVEDLLPDLLADSELDNISLDVDHMELTDSLQCLQMADETSSDSAVSSMGSSASPVEELNDTTSTMGSLSPYDGVEGATGGRDYTASGNSKIGKYDPDDNYCSYNPYREGDYNGPTNYSSSSNETQDYESPDRNHVQHNHTYPLQPGAQPKDLTKTTSAQKSRPKGPHSRDEKRAKEMKLPFSIDIIILTPVDEFNELMSKYKLTEPQLQLVRDIRRRGKNKVAAQNCRKRKLDSIFTLEDEMNQLKDDKDKLMRERYMIDKETREMKDKFGHLYQEIFQSLRDDNGQPYDPSEFSLQETSDGNVFLVPCNATLEERRRKESGRKRKEKK